jgi:hypothetical protein
VQALKARQGLERGEPVKATSTAAGELQLEVSLPLHALSLFEVAV